MDEHLRDQARDVGRDLDDIGAHAAVACPGVRLVMRPEAAGGEQRQGHDDQRHDDARRQAKGGLQGHKPFSRKMPRRDRRR